MDAADKVTVYAFQVFDAARERYRIAPFKAPRELVTSRFGGEVLQGTSESVPSDDLDERGRFRRVPSGWGALGS
jgi:hypothetical protein